MQSHSMEEEEPLQQMKLEKPDPYTTNKLDNLPYILFLKMHHRPNWKTVKLLE